MIDHHSTNIYTWVVICFKIPPADNIKSNVNGDTSSNPNFVETRALGEDNTTVSGKTTRDTTDAEVIMTEVQNRRDLDSVIYKSASQISDQTLISFLGKPTIIRGSGVFQSTDTVSTFNPIILPQEALSPTIVLNKISGHFGFRATSVLRLQLNGNRFQQGRYMMAAVHLGGASATSLSSVASYNSHISTLTQRTQLPRVEVDINCDTEAILRIPFVSCQNWYNFASMNATDPTIGSVAKVNIFPYTALTVVGGGSTTCNYTIWHHFEDVELMGAAVPQSGRLSISQKENRGLSTALKRTSQATGILSKIPLLTAYTAPLSWVTDILGQAAYTMGWSKPLNTDKIGVVTRKVMSKCPNTDGVDNSESLSLYSDNQVSKLPGYAGTTTDEMDFNVMASIPAWIDSFDWVYTAIATTELYSVNVGPAFGLSTTGAGAKVFYHLPPIDYVAAHFSFWRGSIVYTFKIVKTEFHSGRIAISFTPIDQNNAIGTMTLGDTVYVHREIIDVRLQNQFSVTIPYVSNRPFTPYNSGVNYIGVLKIHVVDPLVAPATVPGTINFHVEAGAGPDFEVAVPNQFTVGLPVMGAVPQSGNVQFSAKPQENPCETTAAVFGTTNPDNLANAGACMGESIKSFRNLLKRPSGLYQTSVYTPTTTPVLAVLPYAFGVYYNAAIPDTPYVTGDLYGEMCSIFCLSRGGVRIKAQFATSSNSQYPVMTYCQSLATTNPTGLSVFTNATYPAGANSAAMSDTNGMNFTVHPYSQNQCVEVSIPPYHRYHSRVNSSHMATTTIPYLFVEESMTDRMSLSILSSGCQIEEPIIMRSGKDDVDFGLFISIPPFTGVLSNFFPTVV